MGGDRRFELYFGNILPRFFCERKERIGGSVGFTQSRDISPCGGFEFENGPRILRQFGGFPPVPFRRQVISFGLRGRGGGHERLGDGGVQTDRFRG